MTGHKPKLVGGFGEKLSNGGTQWYQQNRVYSAIGGGSVAMALPANLPGGSYMYLVEEPIRLGTTNEFARDHQSGSVFDVNGTAPTLCSGMHGNSIVPQILVEGMKKEMVDALPITLFESEKFKNGDERLRKDGCQASLRAEKVCCGIIEVYGNE